MRSIYVLSLLLLFWCHYSDIGGIIQTLVVSFRHWWKLFRHWWYHSGIGGSYSDIGGIIQTRIHVGIIQTPYQKYGGIIQTKDLYLAKISFV